MIEMKNKNSLEDASRRLRGDGGGGGGGGSGVVLPLPRRGESMPRGAAASAAALSPRRRRCQHHRLRRLARQQQTLALRDAQLHLSPQLPRRPEIVHRKRATDLRLEKRNLDVDLCRARAHGWSLSSRVDARTGR